VGATWGLQNGFEVFGVKNGYEGLINGIFHKMGTRDVGGFCQARGAGNYFWESAGAPNLL